MQNINFDFFNYAGIHRSVLLYTTPKVYVDDITVATDFTDSTGKRASCQQLERHLFPRPRSGAYLCFLCASGLVKYKVAVQGAATFSMKVNLVDKDGRSVATSSEQSGVLKVADVKLWWPYLMHEKPAYLYSLEVRRQARTSHKKILNKNGSKENALNGYNKECLEVFAKLSLSIFQPCLQGFFDA